MPKVACIAIKYISRFHKRDYASLKNTTNTKVMQFLPKFVYHWHTHDNEYRSKVDFYNFKNAILNIFDYHNWLPNSV